MGGLAVLEDDDLDLVEAGDFGRGARANGEDVVRRNLGAAADEELDAAGELDRKSVV